MEYSDKYFIPMSPDGQCFLAAVSTCLAVDHKRNISPQSLGNVCFDYMMKNMTKFLPFFSFDHTSRMSQVEQFIEEASKFFNQNIYQQGLVDFMVSVASEALSIDIIVHTPDKKKTQVLEFRKEGNTREVFVQLVSEHYGAWVQRSEVPKSSLAHVLHRREITALMDRLGYCPKRRFSDEERETSEMKCRQDGNGHNLTASEDSSQLFDGLNVLADIATQEMSRDSEVLNKGIHDSGGEDDSHMTQAQEVAENEAGQYKLFVNETYSCTGGENETHNNDVVDILHHEEEDEIHHPEMDFPEENEEEEIEHGLFDQQEMMTSCLSNDTGDTNTDQEHDIVTLEDNSQGSMSEDQQESNTDVPKIGKGVPFPMGAFNGVEPQLVSQVPDNIDGVCVYKVLTTQKRWCDDTSDLRHFTMRTSSNVRFRGVRKVGKCSGNLICPNNNCDFKRTSEGIANTSQFGRLGLGGPKKCLTCETVAQQTLCCARKMVQFDPVTEYAHVYHLGLHQCTLQPDTRRKKATIQRDIEEMGAVRKLSANVLIRKQIGRHVEKGDLEEAKRVALTYDNPRLVSRVQNKVLSSLTPGDTAIDENSFDAVGLARKMYKDTDPYLIYRINNGSLNDMSDYVFKSSRECAHLAISMDVDGPHNPLQYELVYFDGKHNRVQGFISFGLWLRHPAIRKLIRLASMEMRTENTHDIYVFFTLFNEILAKEKGVPGYKFNPRGFMCDAAGPNLNALTKVYGMSLLTAGRIQTCFWHFTSDARKHSSKVPPETREEFIKLCRTLANETTVKGYEDRLAEARMCAPKGQVNNFLNYWDARRGTVMLAFRAAGFPNCNLSEMANAGWDRENVLSLLEAARDDTTSMIQQIGVLKSFLTNQGAGHGRAPSQAQRAARNRVIQMRQASQLSTLVSDEHAQALQCEELNNPQHFLPSGGGKHKAPKSTGSLLGSFLTDGGTRIVERTASQEASQKEGNGEDRQQEEVEEKEDNEDDEETVTAGGYRDDKTEEEMSETEGRVVEEAVEEEQEAAADLDEDEQEKDQNVPRRGRRGQGSFRGRSRGRGRGGSKQGTIGSVQGSSVGRRGRMSQGTTRGQGVSKRCAKPSVTSSQSSEEAPAVGIDKEEMEEQVKVAEKILKCRVTKNTPEEYSGRNICFPTLVMSRAHPSVRRCFGCDNDITRANRVYPKDIFFQRKARRPRFAAKKGEWYTPREMSNTYYHINIDCLRAKDSSLEKRNISCSDEVWVALTEEQMEVLKRAQFLYCIAANKKS